MFGTKLIYYIFSLTLGGMNNPFLESEEQYAYDASGMRIQGENQQYYGGGYTQAQSGYSSSGFGESLGSFIILFLHRIKMIFKRY